MKIHMFCSSESEKWFSENDKDILRNYQHTCGSREQNIVKQWTLILNRDSIFLKEGDMAL